LHTSQPASCCAVCESAAQHLVACSAVCVSVAQHLVACSAVCVSVAQHLVACCAIVPACQLQRCLIKRGGLLLGSIQLCVCVWCHPRITTSVCCVAQGLLGVTLALCVCQCANGLSAAISDSKLIHPVSLKHVEKKGQW
jgi:hypothetical protein